MLALMAALKPLSGGGGGGGGLSVVGAVTGGSTAANYAVSILSLTPPGGGAAVAAQAGDEAWVWTGWGSTVDAAPGVDSGVTTGFVTALGSADLYQAGTRACNMALQHRVLTATDITTGSITVKGPNTAGRGGGTVIVVTRGQNASPLDGSVQTAAGTTESFDAPSYTPSVSGDLILAFGAGTRPGTPGGAGTLPTDMTLLGSLVSAGTAIGLQVAAFLKTGVGAGTAFNPDATVGPNNNASDTWLAATMGVKS